MCTRPSVWSLINQCVVFLSLLFSHFVYFHWSYGIRCAGSVRVKNRSNEYRSLASFIKVCLNSMNIFYSYHLHLISDLLGFWMFVIRKRLYGQLTVDNMFVIEKPTTHNVNGAYVHILYSTKYTCCMRKLSENWFFGCTMFNRP